MDVELEKELEGRFKKAKRKISNAFKRRHKQTHYEKEQEKEAVFLMHHIESYGFKFFPDHYILKELGDLERIASDVQ